jgi:hypothetical protein
MWQELLNILRKLGNDYGAVEALGKQKHAALVGVDMKTLDRLVKREADLASSIKKTESARQELCVKIIKAYPSITPDTKMQEAYQLAGPLARELKSAHEALSTLVEKVKAQAEINNILAMGALGAVNQRLGQLGGVSVDPVYGRGGREQVSHRQNFEYDA